MTSAEFHERYQILQQVAHGSVRSFHALAATGAVVMVHYVDHTGLRDWVRSAIDGLRPTDRKRVLEIANVDDTPVVVTRFVLDFTSLTEWLHEHRADPGAPPPPPGLQSVPEATAQAPFEKATPPPHHSHPVPPPPHQQTPGQATPEPPSHHRQAPVPTQAFPSHEQPSAAQRPPPAEAGPGEFTRMFRLPESHAGDSPSGQDAAGGPAPGAQAPEGSAPAGRPPAGQAPPSPAAPPAGKEPGEFTRMFRQPEPVTGESPAAGQRQGPAGPGSAGPEPTSRIPGGQAPPPPPPPATRAAPATPVNEAGEFTRMFRPPPAAGSAPPPRAGEIPPAEQAPSSESGSPSTPPTGPGEFTRQFRTPGTSGPERPPSPAPPSGSTAPDDFARIFRPAAPSDRPESSRPVNPAGPPETTGPIIPPSPPPRSPGQPGDFTSVFRAPQTGQTGSAGPQRSGPASGTGAGEGGVPGSWEAGGETYLDRLSSQSGSARPAEPEPPAPKPHQPPEAGEFTRMLRSSEFQVPGGPQQTPPAGPLHSPYAGSPPVPGPHPAGGQAGPGSAAPPAMNLPDPSFRTPQPPTPPSPPPGQPYPPSYPPPQPPRPPEVPPHPQPQPTPPRPPGVPQPHDRSAGPSEFTRVISSSQMRPPEQTHQHAAAGHTAASGQPLAPGQPAGSGQPQPAAAGQPAAQSPAGAGQPQPDRTSQKVLIAGLIVITLLAIALIVFFVLTSGPTGAEDPAIPGGAG